MSENEARDPREKCPRCGDMRCEHSDHMWSECQTIAALRARILWWEAFFGSDEHPPEAWEQLRAENERLTADNNEKALALATARVILRDLGPHLWAMSVMGSTNEEEARALRLLGLKDSSARTESKPPAGNSPP